MTPRTDDPVQMEEIDTNLNIDISMPEEKPADFEKAVSAAGYGKFHVLLFLVVIPAAWSSSIDTTNLSMILSSAECDLGLTFLHKGILNAITYAGMVSSALLWGFLADVIGRRQILVYGYIADGICNILCGLSPNFSTLLVFKFLSGFVISGPFATIMSYCAEFHLSKDRPRVMLVVGTAIFIGCIFTAGLAWAVIPQSWSLVIVEGYYNYNSWRIFLSLCGLPILIGAIGFSFFPESPKFLMSQGRNEEALEVFKKMYTLNTGRPSETYPIKLLENEAHSYSMKESSTETEVCQKSLKSCLREGLSQMKPLFIGSYLPRLLLLIVMQFCIMLTSNTIRLWQPQLFASIKEHTMSSDSEETFCEILDKTVLSNANKTVALNGTNVTTCVSAPMDGSVYLDTIIVSIVTACTASFASVIVNYVGNIRLILISHTIAIAAIMYMNWSTSALVTLALTCLFVGLITTATSLVISLAVDLFPTSLRTMAVSLAMMIGRCGALLGNVMFPILLNSGCFIAIGSQAAFLIVGIIFSLFVPKRKESIK